MANFGLNRSAWASTLYVQLVGLSIWVLTGCGGGDSAASSASVDDSIRANANAPSAPFDGHPDTTGNGRLKRFAIVLDAPANRRCQ